MSITIRSSEISCKLLTQYLKINVNWIGFSILFLLLISKIFLRSIKSVIVFETILELFILERTEGDEMEGMLVRKHEWENTTKKAPNR